MALRQQGPLHHIGVQAAVAAGVCAYSWFTQGKGGKNLLHQNPAIILHNDNGDASTVPSLTLAHGTTGLSLGQEYTTPTTDAVYGIITDARPDSPHTTTSLPVSPRCGRTEDSFSLTPIRPTIVTPAAPETAVRSSPTLAENLAQLPGMINLYFSLAMSLLVQVWSMLFGQGWTGWISFAFFLSRWVPNGYRPKLLRRNSPRSVVTSRMAWSNYLKARRHLRAAQYEVHSLNATILDVTAAAAASARLARFCTALLLAALRTRTHELEVARSQAVAASQSFAKQLAALQLSEAKLRSEEAAKAGLETDRLRAELLAAEVELSKQRDTLAARAEEWEETRKQREDEIAMLSSETDRERRHHLVQQDLLRKTAEQCSERGYKADLELSRATKAHLVRREQLAKVQQQLEESHVAGARGQQLLDESKKQLVEQQALHDEELVALKAEAEKAAELRNNENARLQHEVHGLHQQLQTAQKKANEQDQQLAAASQRVDQLQDAGTQTEAPAGERRPLTRASLRRVTGAKAEAEISNLRRQLEKSQQQLLLARTLRSEQQSNTQTAAATQTDPSDDPKLVEAVNELYTELACARQELGQAHAEAERAAERALRNKPEVQVASIQTEGTAEIRGEASTTSVETASTQTEEPVSAVPQDQDAELTSTRHELAQAHMTLASAAEHVRALEGQVAQAASGHQDAQNMIQSLNSEFQRVQEELNMMVAQREADRGDALQFAHNANLDLEQARKERDEWRQQVAELQSRLMTLSASTNTSQDSHVAELEAIRQAEANFKSRLSSMEQQLGAEKTDLVAQLKLSENSCDMMRTQVERQKRKTAALETELQKQKEDFESFKAQAADDELRAMIALPNPDALSKAELAANNAAIAGARADMQRIARERFERAERERRGSDASTHTIPWGEDTNWAADLGESDVDDEDAPHEATSDADGSEWGLPQGVEPVDIDRALQDTWRDVMEARSDDGSDSSSVQIRLSPRKKLVPKGRLQRLARGAPQPMAVDESNIRPALLSETPSTGPSNSATAASDTSAPSPGPSTAPVDQAIPILGLSLTPEPSSGAPPSSTVASAEPYMDPGMLVGPRYPPATPQTPANRTTDPSATPSNQSARSSNPSTRRSGYPLFTPKPARTPPTLPPPAGRPADWPSVTSNVSVVRPNLSADVNFAAGPVSFSDFGWPRSTATATTSPENLSAAEKGKEKEKPQ